jgi:4-methyl-5(b-hydroxyethyl)-thiazole monophosphate biosynthesis
MVFGGLGILKGKRATAYPGFEQYLDGAIFVPEPAVVDGNIITGRGPGFTYDFALTLLEILESKHAREEVAKQLLLA